METRSDFLKQIDEDKADFCIRIDNPNSIVAGGTRLYGHGGECYLRIASDGSGGVAYLLLGAVFDVSEKSKLIQQSLYNEYYYFFRGISAPLSVCLRRPDGSMALTVDFISADCHQMGGGLVDNIHRNLASLAAGGGKFAIKADRVKNMMDGSPNLTRELDFNPESRPGVLKAVMPEVLNRSLWELDEKLADELQRNEFVRKTIEEKRYLW